jgi:hypothetical protein
LDVRGVGGGRDRRAGEESAEEAEAREGEQDNALARVFGIINGDA